MRYADLDTVLRHVFNEPFFDPDDPANEPILQELENLEEGVAALIDKTCNRTFGSIPVAEARVISDYRTRRGPHGWTDVWLMPLGDPLQWTGLTYYDQVDDGVYILPWGVRNVTLVSVNGDWDGTTWDDEVTIDDADWQLMYRSETPEKWAHGIVITGAGYGTSVRVLGEWNDGSPSATVPPEIREAASYIVADAYRTRELSPAGEIGPNGLASYVRNVWEEPFVKMALKENTFRQLVI